MPSLKDYKSMVSLYTLPGIVTKIYAMDLVVENKNRTHRRMDGTIVENAALVNGFIVDREDVGTIEAVPNEPAIRYTHKKFAENYITFYARTGEVGKVFINSVPIHDHSSIVTGGPAYGTYFADDDTTEGV